MMPSEPTVSIVIVNHNGSYWLPNLLESIRNQHYTNLEVILVDNLSTDDSLTFVRSTFPDVTILDPKANLGFGRAANLGARAAKGEFLIFLNEDMKLGRSMIHSLLQCYRESHGESIGIIAAHEVAYDDASITKSRGCNIDRFAYAAPNLEREAGELGRFFYAPGAPCFIPTAVFHEVGGYEEFFFLYFEDADLSWKVRLLGYDIKLCDKAIIFHAGGGTTNRHSPTTSILLQRNRLCIQVKNLTGTRLFAAIAYGVPHTIAVGTLRSIELGSASPLVNIGKALWQATLLLPKVLKRRRFIQNRRRISEREIVSLMSATRIGPRPTIMAINLVRRVLGKASCLIKHDKS